jgi:hypothetical protein
MPAALKLESPDALPAELRVALARYTDVFLANTFIDRVLENAAIRAIGEELERFLAAQHIHAYHCTKEPDPGYFQASGLRLTEVAVHQAWFLEQFGPRFTEAQRQWLQTAWDQYFVKEGQAKLRNGLLWACLSRSLVADEGCEPFFEYLGGEAISMVADANRGVASVLRAIGRPVVVEVAVLGGRLKASYPMSYSVLSQYHVGLRADARLFESEARWRHAVSPSDILAVTPLERFNP